MSEAVQIIVGVLSILTVVGGVVAGLVRWLHRHIRKDITEAIERQVEPLAQRLDIAAQERSADRSLLAEIKAEVTYDHGTSLKDGVRAIARHLQIDIQEGPFVTVLDPDAPRRDT